MFVQECEDGHLGFSSLYMLQTNGAPENSSVKGVPTSQGLLYKILGRPEIKNVLFHKDITSISLGVSGFVPVYLSCPSVMTYSFGTVNNPGFVNYSS